MRVLLLGSNGMLGQSIFNRFTAMGIDVRTAGRTNAQYCFDFTNDGNLNDCILKARPDIVINTAAIVDLNLCEKDVGSAYQVNARIPGILAEICREHKIYFIQISTDHYYPEEGSKKHSELERVTLVNEYARTKYIGEQLALTYEDSLVLRTNIVGFRGRGKATFVEWVINELEKGNELNLFMDFYTSSIHTMDFANILADVIEKQPTGVYNLASSDVNNKMSFVVALSKALFNKTPIYKEATVLDINGPKRAASLGLDTSKIESLVGYRMPGLEETIESLKEEYIERKKKNAI